MTGSENLATAARVVALVMASCLCASAQAALAPREGPTLAAAQQKLAARSVPFVPNAGQWDSRAAFAAQTFAGTVFVTKQGELVYSLPGKAADAASPPTSASRSRERSPGWALSETLVDANGQPRGMNQGTLKAPSGVHSVESQVSYLTGGSAATLPGSVSAYERVNLGDMYPGVNVQLRATHTKAGSNVEKIFTVAPKHDPKQIQIKLAGAQKLEIGAQGELVAHTGNGPVAFTAPIAFQETATGERVAVSVAYALDAAQHRYGFALGDYDTARPLVIDPLLASTYLGGAAYEQVNAIAIHPHSGQVYVAGFTGSPSFPQSGTGAQTSASGNSCFVSRYSADLQQLLQSTYLGSDNVRCLAMAIHPGSGVVYVAGSASGTSTFPAGSMTGAIQPSHGDTGNSGAPDGFVALLSADLRTLTKATFFGGVTAFQDEWINAIAVHPQTGFVHIAGTTNTATLPGTAVGTQSTFGGGGDAFSARLPADLMGAANVRYTFIGGNDTDFGNALAIDPRSGDVFVAGNTNGGLLPAMLSGAAQGTHAGNGDAFVARLKQDLSAVVRATYLGGTGYEQARRIALHPLTGEVLVAGNTSSSDLPQRAGGAQPAFGGGFSDGFVSRLSADLTSILQTTYVGGTGNDCQVTCSVAIHPTSGEVFVAGDTSGSLPATLVADGYQSSYGGGSYDAFIVRLNAALTARRAGTYLGGTGLDHAYTLAVEPNGQSVYVAGLNNFAGFPTANAQQATFGGGGDGFVSRLSTDLTAVNRIPNPFNFLHQSNVAPNTIRTSNEVRLVITPTPPNNQQTAYVTGAVGSELCVATQPDVCVTPYVGCTSPCFATGWFTGTWDFLSGDYIAVRHTSANPSGTTETTLIISGTAYPFRSSTGNANIACNLDMNGDNVLSHTVEGLVLVRAMLGFGADAIVAGTGVPAWNPVRERLNAFCGSNFPFSPSAFQ